MSHWNVIRIFLRSGINILIFGSIKELLYKMINVFEIK